MAEERIRVQHDWDMKALSWGEYQGKILSFKDRGTSDRNRQSS